MRYYSELDWLVSWKMIALLCLFYVCLIVFLYLARRNKEALKLRQFTLVYNAMQIAVCGWMLRGFLAATFSWSNPMGLNRAYTRDVEYWMLVHYGTKVLDFSDTVIMLAKKNYKQVTFLHVYHHLSILMVWGYLLQCGDANGTAYFGAMLNSGVHLIMYSHYLYVSFGWINPLKPVVTNIQLLQFLLCLVHAVLVVLRESVLPARLAYLQLAYHSVMLLLFGDYKVKQMAALRAQRNK